MIKKIAGYVLIVFSAVLFIFLILGIPNSINTIMAGLNKSDWAFSLGFVAGQIFFKLVLFVMAFLLFRFGRKLIKKEEAVEP